MDAVDLEIAQWVADHRVAAVTAVCQFLEDLGTSPLFFVVIGLIGIAFVAYRRMWSGFGRVVVAMVVTVNATSPLKELFDRPRPSPELAITTQLGPSMPSSHAIVTSAIVVAVLMAPGWTSERMHRMAAVMGVVGCATAAAAMVYLGGHWVSDIAIGWLLGAGITAAVMHLWERARAAVSTQRTA